MNMTSNVHTHTIMCDGRDSARAMVDRALQLGFTDLGFSAHSSAPFDPTCPGLDDEGAYMREIAALQREYSGRIGILCGLERDGCCQPPTGRYDYIIGALHYIKLPDHGLFAVDGDPADLSSGVQKIYQSRAIDMVVAYYEQYADKIEEMRPDIAGHFDLIVKFNRRLRLFDEDAADYRRAALSALDRVLDALAPYGGMIELNYGAVLRGLRSDPYPAPFLLRHMAQRKARVIVTSDAHSVKRLSAPLPSACRLLRDCGFSSMTLLRDGEFTDVALPQ